MSVNKYQPHILVIPEDDANRQLANGFLLGLDPATLSRIQVLPEVGGWKDVLHRFGSDHLADMDRYTNRYIVLLVDFDGKEDRLNHAKGKIPQHLEGRVFILGTLSEPEALRSAALGSYETIGKAMAKDCRNDTETTWGHNLPRHNASEIGRLRQHVRPILFP